MSHCTRRFVPPAGVLFLVLLVVAESTPADEISIGPAGIGVLDAAGNRLTLPGGAALDGSGVKLGQVEQGRPARSGTDAASRVHPNVSPAGVSVRGGAATPNTDLDDHAEQAAGVMISTVVPAGSGGNAALGVAPGASLYSSAYVTLGTNPGYQHAVQAMQRVAQQGAVAINNSWGKPLASGGLLDGSSQLTLGADWIASRFDVLQVVAGNESTGTNPRIPLMGDNYNGLTIGYTQLAGGSFTALNPGNTFDEDAAGARRSIALVAPGTNLLTTSIDTGGNGVFGQLGDVGTTTVSGTSFAAPHVTVTAALLRQFADDRIAHGQPGFSADALRHQVTKAVLMNSADKVSGILGMTKTITSRGEVAERGEPFHDFGADGAPGTFDAGENNGAFNAGEPFSDSNGSGMRDSGAPFFDANNNGVQDGPQNWLASDAFAERSIPLDAQLGAGQLNAARALTQFAAGESHAGGIAPLVGWDFGRSVPSVQAKYELAAPLLAGTFLSATLAWDRRVTLDDVGTDGLPGTQDADGSEGNGLFDLGETFAAAGLTDLNLYLLPHGAASIAQSVWASTSAVDAVEHVFFQIPEDGRYDLWVVQNGATAGGGGQDYGLAWWTAVPEPPAIVLAVVCAVVWMATRARSRQRA